MLKLKDLIKEEKCDCGCGGCETKLNESVDLPPGVELGRIFTGNGFAFKKEEFEEGTCGYGVDGELGDEPAGPHLIKKKKVGEGLIDVDKQMKDGTFDEKNPQIHIQGYGVMGMKTLGNALSRKLTDLAKRAKKGEIENVDSVLNKSGVLQGFVKAYMDAKKQLKSSSMKRKITKYKRSRR